MILDELEEDFRDRQRAAGRRMVILAIQIDEQDVKALRPRLETRGISLSERVRDLIQSDIPTRHDPKTT